MSTYSRPAPRKLLKTAASIRPVLTKAASLRPEPNRWSKWQMPPLHPALAEAAEPESIEPTTPPEPSPEELAAAREIALAQEIEALKQKAYQEAYAQGHEAGLSAGYKAGYAQGQSEGLLQAQELGAKQIADKIQIIDKMIEVSHEQYQQLEHAMAEGVLSLAIHVAQHVLGHELHQPTDATFQSVKRVLAQHDSEGELLTFWLHPSDLEALQESITSLPCLSRLRLLSDATLTPGGVRAQTSHGDIDATLETRWKTAIGALGQGE